MKKDFMLSKSDLFVIFQFHKVSMVIVVFVMIIGVIHKIILFGGFSGEILISCLEYIGILFLIFGVIFSLVYLKFKKVPYKIIFDDEQQAFFFFLCYTGSIKKLYFSEILKIEKRSRYLMFYTNNGQKFVWSINSQNQVLLETLLSKNSLTIDK